MRRMTWTATAALLAAALLIGPTGAVQTTHVEQTSEQDFHAGTFDGVVSNSRGELRLARKLDVLLKDDKEVAFVNALAIDPQGAVYAATAPAGKLFRIVNDKPELYYQAKGKTLQSLAVGSRGELFVGTGGGDGKVIQVTGKEQGRVVLEKKGLAYVWALLALPDGSVVAGTGPNAELISFVPGDKPVEGTVLFKPEKLKAKNILSLAADGKQIYFGTDADGLVFRYDTEAKRAFVLYDAAESEIAALLAAPDGHVYAATSDPRQAEGEGPAQGPPMGRPESQPLTAPQTGPNETADGGSRGDGEPDGDGEEASAGHEGPAAVPVPMAVVTVPPRSRAGGEAARSTPTTQKESAKAGPTAATRPARSAPASQPAAAPSGLAIPRATAPSAELMARMRAAMRGAPGGPGGPEGPGNAVYRISPDGFVTEVLRRPGMMLALLWQNGQVIVGAGEGRILAAVPSQEEVSTLVKPLSVKQVLAMAQAKDGTIYLGTANQAIIARVGAGHGLKGTFTSAPIDARQISRWGVIRQRTDLPAGATLRVQTRSGNLAEPDDSLWSAWTEPVAAAEPIKIASPSARFLQYRLTLAAEKDSLTPVVDSVSVAYTNENQPPRLAAIKVMAPGIGEEGEGGGPQPPGPGPRMPRPTPPRMPAMPARGGPGGEEEGAPGAVTVLWQGADPNEDPLEFSLFFRQLGRTAWIPLTEKPIRNDVKFRWPTRGVPDGRYQVKVVASDAPGNPAGLALTDARISNPFTIDNTPPAINNFRIVGQNGARITVAAEPDDAISRLASAELKIDSAADGQVLSPLDGVWDESRESLKAAIDLSDRPAGAHLLILTVTDAAGNSTSASLEVVKH